MLARIAAWLRRLLGRDPGPANLLSRPPRTLGAARAPRPLSRAGAPLDPAAFTAAVASHVRGRFPDSEARPGSPLALVVRHREQELDVHLENAYRAYQQEPEQAQALIARYVEGLLGRPDQRFSAPAARERLLPRLVDRGGVRQFRGMLAARPLASGLLVAYVVDEADRMTYVTRERLEEWEMTLPDVDRLARENLAAITAPESLVPTRLGPGHLLWSLNATDGYAASRLLLAAQLLEWAGPMPGRPLFCVPARDHLYLWGEGDAVVTAAVERFGREAFATSPYPISPAVFCWDGGRLARYRGEADDDGEP